MKSFFLSIFLIIPTLNCLASDSVTHRELHETLVPRVSEYESLDEALAQADLLRRSGQYLDAVLVVQQWINVKNHKNDHRLVCLAHERIARFWNGKGENEVVVGKHEDALESFKSAEEQIKTAENFAVSATDKQPLALQRYFWARGRSKVGELPSELLYLRNNCKKLTEQAIQDELLKTDKNEEDTVLLLARLKHELAFLLSDRLKGEAPASPLELAQAQKLYMEAKQDRKHGQRAMTSSRLWVVAAHSKNLDLAISELKEASLFYRENFDQQRLNILIQDIEQIQNIEQLDLQFVKLLQSEYTKIIEAIKSGKI